MSGEAVTVNCRNCGAKISGCVSCGRRVITDDVRVGITFAPEDLARLIGFAPLDMRERLLCALGTVDGQLENRTRQMLADDMGGCTSCPVLADKLATAEADIDEMAGILTDMEQCGCP